MIPIRTITRINLSCVTAKARRANASPFSTVTKTPIKVSRTVEREGTRFETFVFSRLDRTPATKKSNGNSKKKETTVSSNKTSRKKKQEESEDEETLDKAQSDQSEDNESGVEEENDEDEEFDDDEEQQDQVNKARR